MGRIRKFFLSLLICLLISFPIWVPVTIGVFLEFKVARVAERISNLPDSHWKEVFVATERLHSRVYHGEEQRLEMSKLETVLGDLGFEECTILAHSVSFYCGGGHLQNSAYVEVFFGTAEESESFRGIRIGGSRRRAEIPMPIEELPNNQLEEPVPNAEINS